ncbi:hypothetical protein [Kribbella speibonae]|uniref:Uncharacterized protein n=1 Tax=Kribbella speibonae TaxID=1572660 RepID=A0A4R0J4Y3_9ACTN|nr:hypothetical protein [Kribbella speibonae]TCC36355.1 hypothetical protein E0H92_27290 [Kribbella speibonae]
MAEEPLNDIANAVRSLIRHENGTRPRDPLGDASIEVRLTNPPADDFKTLLERGYESSCSAMPIQLDIGTVVTIRIVSTDAEPGSVHCR